MRLRALLVTGLALLPAAVAWHHVGGPTEATTEVEAAAEPQDWARRRGGRQGVPDWEIDPELSLIHI